MLTCFSAVAEGTILQVYVQPRASRNQISGLHGDRLKLKLTSPPVDGAANKACCAYLAKLFRLAKSDVVLLSGDTSRQKRFLLSGLDPESASSVLNSYL